MTDFLVCNKCLSGVKAESKEVFEQIGKIKKGTNECTCGGEFTPMNAEDAVGVGGVLDTVISRGKGNKPS